MPRKATWLVGLTIAAILSAGPGASGQPRRGRPPKRPPGGSKGRPPNKGKQPDKTAPKGPDVYQLMKLYEAREYISVSGKLPYRMLRPLSYSSSRRYPMVVCLHGVPGRGKDNALQLGCTYPVSVLARDDMRTRYPSFVLVPQSTTWWGDEPYGTKHTAGSAKKSSGAKRSRKDPPMMTMLLECIEALEGVFSIDPNRVYVTGHSMGGFGAFNALASDPNMFAAAVVVGGGGDPNTAASFAHVPVWVYCGAKSSILHYSENMVMALRKVGGSPKFTVLPDVGHRCWAQVYDSQAMWDWLFAQRRVWPRRYLTTQPTTWPASLPATGPPMKFE